VELSSTLLGALTCETPVLATPVGAIPDVIIDGKTGFIMENNSPECIGRMWCGRSTSQTGADRGGREKVCGELKGHSSDY
jgi:hypothetical protein